MHSVQPDFIQRGAVLDSNLNLNSFLTKVTTVCLFVRITISINQDLRLSTITIVLLHKVWEGRIEKDRSFLALLATRLLSLQLEEGENNHECDVTRRDASRRKHTRGKQQGT